MTKVLFVGDLAGVNSLFAKYMARHGSCGKIRLLPRMLRPNCDAAIALAVSYGDPYHISKDNGANMSSSTKQFYMKAFLYNLVLTPDAIVISIGTPKLIRDIILKFTNKKTIKILQYHGSDIRNLPREQQDDLEKNYDRIWVTTTDLLDYERKKRYIYVPQLVDTDKFHRRSIANNNCGLVMMKRNQTKDQTLQQLKKIGRADIDWTCIARTSDISKLHLFNTKLNSEMPDLLSQYEYYGNVYWMPGIGGWVKPNLLSGTALQSLSLGLKVVLSDGSVVKELPRQHHPKAVMDNLAKIIFR